MSKKADSLEDVVIQLAAAPLTRERASNKPWNHGWAFGDYRLSPNAATIPASPVLLYGEGAS